MALQVTKGEGFWADQGTSHGRHWLLEIAKALSAHAGWDIIDSFATAATPARLNGDPISGGLWGGLDKTNLSANAWFIAEQANPTGGRPAMQVKFQSAAGSTFDDPSGNDYGWEGSSRVSAVRFAPFGGWDLDPSTPDFANPLTKATENYQVQCDDGADNGNWYFHIDDDHIMFLMYDTTDSNWHSIGFYVGEYEPMFGAQDTVDHPAYCYIGSNADQPNNPAFLGIASLSSQFIAEDPSSLWPWIACPDENGDIQYWTLWCPPMSDGFIEGTMAPNEFDPVVGIDLIEVLFGGLARSGSPDSRMIGSMKHVWRGWGIGLGGFIGAKQYLTLGGNVACAIVDWDGSTSL
jgi:hypothetical protein